MYSLYYGTVISHIVCFLSALWSLLSLDFTSIYYKGYVVLAYVFLLCNTAVALVRYGNANIGYKLRRLHIITLNISSILSFALVSADITNAYASSNINSWLTLATFISLVANILEKDYKSGIKTSDAFIFINCCSIFYLCFINENYYGISLVISYIFNYFVVGQSGYFLDTELPSIDMSQYAQVFVNIYMLKTLSNLKRE